MKVSYRDKFLVLLLSVYMAILPSCGKDSATGPEQTPPVLPSVETMQMSQQDLEFWTQTASGTAMEALGAQPGLNWVTAAIVFTTFNLAVFLAMAVPVSITAATVSQTPTLESDGKFHWRISHSHGGLTYEGDLVAEVAATSVKWQMFVSINSAFLNLADFLWYDGETQIDGTSGFWRFYDVASPAEQADLARIDWTAQADSIRSLRFSDQKTGSQGFGNTLNYSVEGDSVSVQFTESASSNITRIAWHRQTRQGYIVAPNFRNGNRACWLEDLSDDNNCSGSNLEHPTRENSLHR